MSRARAVDADQAMGAPGQMPSAAPTFAVNDHSFSLQIFLDMQKTVGRLEGAINAMEVTIKEHSDRHQTVMATLQSEIKATLKEIADGHQRAFDASQDASKSMFKDLSEDNKSSLKDISQDHKASITGLQGDLKAVSDKLSGVTHKMYAAGVVLTIAVVIGGWLVNKSWDLVSAIATPALKEAMATPTKLSSPSQ